MVCDGQGGAPGQKWINDINSENSRGLLQVIFIFANFDRVRQQRLSWRRKENLWTSWWKPDRLRQYQIILVKSNCQKKQSFFKCADHHKISRGTMGPGHEERNDVMHVERQLISDDDKKLYARFRFAILRQKELCKQEQPSTKGCSWVLELEDYQPQQC